MPDTAPPGRPNPFAWLWDEIARRYGAAAAADLHAGFLDVCRERHAAIRNAPRNDDQAAPDWLKRQQEDWDARR